MLKKTDRNFVSAFGDFQKWSKNFNFKSFQDAYLTNNSWELASCISILTGFKIVEFFIGNGLTPHYACQTFDGKYIDYAGESDKQLSNTKVEVSLEEVLTFHSDKERLGFVTEQIAKEICRQMGYTVKNKRIFSSILEYKFLKKTKRTWEDIYTNGNCWQLVDELCKLANCKIVILNDKSVNPMDWISSWHVVGFIDQKYVDINGTYLSPEEIFDFYSFGKERHFRIMSYHELMDHNGHRPRIGPAEMIGKFLLKYHYLAA